MAGMERQRPYFRREAPPNDRLNQGRAGTPITGEQSGKPEIHYDGTPTVTVRLANGIPQDVPHLYVDSRGGKTRWWVERESIASWQEQVRAAKERGDKRYSDISPDDIPSTVTHNFPDIPLSILQRHPNYANREWVTLSYSLAPNDEGEIHEHTFLNTPAATEEETTIFSRRVKVEMSRDEIQSKTVRKHIGDEAEDE